MGKSSAPATSTTNNITKLPEFIEQGGKDNYEKATVAADNLMPAYSGNMIAGINSDQQAAYDMTRQGATLSQPTMQNSMNTLNREENYTPQQVSTQGWGQLSDAQRNAYLNPYTQNVIDTSMDAMNDARQKALMQTGDQAQAAGAFGGTRHGVMEGTTNAQSVKDQAALAAQLYGQGYQNAQTSYASDADRALTAARSNQTTDLQGSQARTTAAGAGALSGQMAQNSWLQGASGMQAVGDNERAYQQDLLNQQAAQYDAQRNYPLEQLGIRTSALSLTPYGTSSTSTTTSSGGGGNGAGQAIGAVGSLASSLLPFMMMSDERVKTNIKDLGVTDPQTGAPIKQYNYIGDPQKRVGPMAQDLEARGFPTGTTPDGVKTVRAQDALTPTVAKIAFDKNAKTAKFLGAGDGPGLLGMTPPAPKKTIKKKGK